MEMCRICQALQHEIKVDGKFCVLIEIEGVLIATVRTHEDYCDAEVVGEAIDLLRANGSTGSLIELGDVGHWGIGFMPSEFKSSSRTRG
jgi:hypothetical protein